MRLRQVALVARELEPVVDELCHVLGVEVAFRDPGVAAFGLENAVMPVGDTFLEVVSPTRPDASAARFLERRGGDGGYMVIVQTDDLARDRARLPRLGVRVVWEIAFDDIATAHLHPRDVGGAILSLDEARPPEAWRWAGPDWKARVRSDRVETLSGVTLASGDPERLAARWAEVLERPAEPAGDAFRIRLDGSEIRFVASRAAGVEGIAGVQLAAADRAAVLAAARERDAPAGDDHVVLGGTCFNLT